MFRSFFRVVVVAVVVLGLTLSFAPVAQAGTQSTRTPALAKADAGWCAAALAWVARVVSGAKPSPSPMTADSATGSCIDPWGIPRCP
jgi:hypothetical protein